MANNLRVLKKHGKYSISILGVVSVLALLFASCEKDITVDLPQPDSKIVIEGYIFQGERPYVLLSRNSAYFAPIDSTTLANSIIYDAIVTVSDGINIDTLTFQSSSESPVKYAYVKQNPTIIGQAGKTYFLKVIANGDTATASTTIVPPTPIDSLRWKPYNDIGDTLGLVWTYFKDPGIDERAYRFFSRRVSQNPKRNNRLFRPNTLLTNKVFKGQNFYFGVGRPDKYGKGLSEDKYDQADKNRWLYGDTVKVRLCTIDLPAYNFIVSAEQSMDDSNSPFAAPNNIQTNIKNGLGCWIGYGVSEVQVVCFP